MSERVKLADAASASTLKATDCIFIERDGAVRRATVSALGERTTAYDIFVKVAKDLAGKEGA